MEVTFTTGPLEGQTKTVEAYVYKFPYLNERGVIVQGSYIREGAAESANNGYVFHPGVDVELQRELRIANSLAVIDPQDDRYQIRYTLLRVTKVELVERSKEYVSLGDEPTVTSYRVTASNGDTNRVTFEVGYPIEVGSRVRVYLAREILEEDIYPVKEVRE